MLGVKPPSVSLTYSAPPAPSLALGAARLTGAREQEIAQLIAAGQTNAEIATALYLRPRTVGHYVSKILLKLGYRSRVRIAADAAAGRLPGGRGTTASAK